MIAVISPFFAVASEVEELQSKISSRTTDIKTLEAQIAAIEGSLKTVGSQKTSLQNTIKEIELTRQKFAADIALTEKKIEAVNQNLQQLGAQITQKGSSIDTNKAALGESARKLRELDDQSLLQILLGTDTMGMAVDRSTTLTELSGVVENEVTTLKQVKQSLEVNKVQVDRERQQLLSLRKNLAAQKALQDANRQDKLDLLATTKGQETTFKKLLADKQRDHAAFEAELIAFQSQLKIAIDPASLPKIGSHALLAPLREMLVTQSFGDTAFSRSALGAVYNGHGHSGTDFRASIGTALYAAAGGKVIGTGDTDLTCKGASYGRWILIEHDNGLSTLYGHLSYIGVSSGNRVASGDQIGYTGSTGYATGPHLHLTVLASKGVSVGKLQSKNKKCGVYTLPIAPLNAYLDPMLYL